MSMNEIVKKIYDLEKKVEEHDVLLQFLLSKMEEGSFSADSLSNDIWIALKKYNDEKKIK